MRLSFGKAAVSYSSFGLAAFLLLVASGAFLIGKHNTPQCKDLSMKGKHSMLPNDLVKFRTSCNLSTVALQDVRAELLTRLYPSTSPFEGIAPVDADKARVKGWGSYGAVFKRLVLETRPRVIIEIGTFLGASALHMANLAKEAGIETTILCIDDFRGWPGATFTRIREVKSYGTLMQQFLENVMAYKQENVILPVPFSTAHSLTAFCDWGITADLIEVDAGHDFHSAWMDINAAYPLLTPKGVMFGHDYHNKADKYGVKRAVDLFAKTKGLRVEPDGQHWILRNP